MQWHRAEGCPSQPHGQGGVAFLPLLPVTLKCLKEKDFDFRLQTLGQQLRKRRLELGLTQAEVASQLGVSLFTVLNLEKDRRSPTLGVLWSSSAG